MTASEPLLDIDGVAHLLAVTVRHVRRLVFERRIPYIKIGGLLRFDPAVIRAWVESQTVHPVGSVVEMSSTRRDRRGA